ncbi:uncharacterized protein [Ptychodera flava]|uniref:uncharacterized protein isoform X1 n=1 Tax=Ptychodera flava TaxID=63121 RepID=UPI00396A67A8
MNRSRWGGKFCSKTELKRRKNVSKATIERFEKNSVDSHSPARNVGTSTSDARAPIWSSPRDADDTQCEPLIPPTNQQIPWYEGVRLVNLGVLARGLDACNVCHEHLRLTQCQSETKYGGGSVLHIPCDQCGSINNVYPSKTHRKVELSRGMQAFDVNAKIATGMITAGIGERHLNQMLSSISVPTIHHKTSKRKEREVGESILKVANQSCKQATSDEMCASKKPRIDVSYDGGWQKRGSGREYKSLSGSQRKFTIT